MAPSSTRSARSTSMVKSTCPGVSMMLMLMSFHMAVRGGGLDGDALLTLEIHRVHLGADAVLAAHLVDLVDLARVEEDALGERRLARVDVGGDADVANAVDGDLRGHGRISSLEGYSSAVEQLRRRPYFQLPKTPSTCRAALGAQSFNSLISQAPLRKAVPTCRRALGVQARCKLAPEFRCPSTPREHGLSRKRRGRDPGHLPARQRGSPTPRGGGSGGAWPLGRGRRPAGGGGFDAARGLRRAQGAGRALLRTGHRLRARRTPASAAARWWTSSSRRSWRRSCSPACALVQSRHAMLHEAQQRQRDLSLLLELTADYAESLDVEALLHDVTRRLAEEMDIAPRRAGGAGRDSGTPASSSPPATTPALKDLRIELARYPEIREVVRTGKPVLVEDAPSHPLLEGVKSARRRAGHPRHRRAAAGRARARCWACCCCARSAQPADLHRPGDRLPRHGGPRHRGGAAQRPAARDRARPDRAREDARASPPRSAPRRSQRYEPFFANVSRRHRHPRRQGAACSRSTPRARQLLDVAAEEARGRHINALTNPMDDGLLMECSGRSRAASCARDVDVQVRTLGGPAADALDLARRR